MPTAAPLQQISENLSKTGSDSMTQAQQLMMLRLLLVLNLLVNSKQTLSVLSKQQSLRFATATWICSCRTTHILSGVLNSLM